MVRSRSERELALMRESGKITALALRKSLQGIKPGVTGIELDAIATQEIKNAGGELAFPTVDDYKWATCITINEQVVHGIPTQRQIQPGDLVSIDVGAIFGGWFTDAAWTVLVRGEGEREKGEVEKERFLAVGQEALWSGVNQAIDKNQIGDISFAIQRVVEGAGYSVVRSLIGHGVGKELHEDPEVPGYGKPKSGVVLKEGMTIAIEVIYTQGGPDVKLESDGWTISSADGSLSGLFEMSVIVGKKYARVLTDWRKISHSGLTE